MMHGSRFAYRFLRAPEGEGGGGAAAAAGAGGADAGAAAAAAAAAAGGGGAAKTASFADSLPADLRESAIFKDIKDLDGLSRSYASAAKMVGLDKGRVLALPTSPDDADGWTAVHTALGRPESADKYAFGDVKLPEGVAIDDARRTAFAGKAHELGLSQKQLDGLYGWYAEDLTGAHGAVAQQAETRRTEAEASLKKDWGAAYDQNVGLAKAALAHYGTDAIRAQLETAKLGETLLGDAPDVMRLFAKLGKNLQEDGAGGRSDAGGGGGIHSPTEARQQIDARKGDAEFMKAYLDGKHPNHKNAVAELEQLHQQAYPTEKVA